MIKSLIGIALILLIFVLIEKYVRYDDLSDL